MSRRGAHTSLRGRSSANLAASAGLARQTSSTNPVNRATSAGGSGLPFVGGAASITNGSRSKQMNDPSRRISEYSSPDDKCPQCRTDRFLNPKLRLLVSPCYHKMCESCIDRIFSLGPAPCPECGRNCRKNQFGGQRFQDLNVEREVDIRSTIGRLFNKREEDFDDLKAYNDYLEEAESLMFNLINNIDLQETNARIERYEQANRNNIATNVKSAVAESEAARVREEEDKSARKAKASRRREREARERVEKEQEERELVEALAGRGGLSVESVMQRQGANAKRREEAKEQEERAEEAAERRRELASGIVRSAARGHDKRKAQGEDDASLPMWTIEMAYDFEGPLAALTDASGLFDVRTQSHLRTTNGAIELGYLDPWTRPSFSDMADHLRAGGWDSAQGWSRSLRSASEVMGLMPRA